MYCANSLSLLRLRVARLYICIAEYRIGRIFRDTYIETLILEHLRNDGRPKIVYIILYKIYKIKINKLKLKNIYIYIYNYI